MTTVANKDILELVASILPRVGDPAEIKKYEPDSADFLLPRLSRVEVPPEDIAQLTAHLRLVPDIAAIENGYYHNDPDGGGGFPIKVESFAEWLLAQSRLRSPEEALSDLLDIIRKNESPVTEIVPIWGLSPKESFRLGKDLHVVPIADWPPSSLKDQMQGRKRHEFSFERPDSFVRPGAAVIRTMQHGPLFEGPDSEPMKKLKRHDELIIKIFDPGGSEDDKQKALSDLMPQEEFWKNFQQSKSIQPLVADLCPVIALLTPEPVFPVAKWYQRPENLPIVGRLAGWGLSANDRPFTRAIQPKDHPIEAIQQVVSQYLALDETVVKRLRTPLSRLNQGRRSLEIGDVENAAVDFGIAAEALLTQDREKDAQLSYIVRVRGTLLLGGTEAEKRQNYQGLRTLYDLRSKIAHEGAFVDRSQIIHSEKVRKKLVEETNKVKASKQLCVNLMLNVIRRGGFPDWNQLMFGW